MEGFDRSATGEKALTLARERRAAEMMRIVKMVYCNFGGSSQTRLGIDYETVGPKVNGYRANQSAMRIGDRFHRIRTVLASMKILRDARSLFKWCVSL